MDDKNVKIEGDKSEGKVLHETSMATSRNPEPEKKDKVNLQRRK